MILIRSSYFFLIFFLSILFSLDSKCNNPLIDTLHVQTRIKQLYLAATPAIVDPNAININWKITISHLDSIVDYTALINDKKNYLSAHTYLAFCYLWTEDYSSMKSTLEKADSTHENFAIDELSFPFYTQQYYWWGQYYYRMGSYETAIEYYKKVLKRVKQGYKVDFPVADIYNNIGTIYSKYEDYEKAIEYYERYAQVVYGVSKALAYQNIARDYQKWGKYSKARYYFYKALDFSPQNGKTRVESIICGNLGEYYMEINKPDSALIYLQLSLNTAIHPETKIRSYIKRAKVYLHQKLFHLADKDIDIAFELAKKTYPEEKHPNLGEIFYLIAKYVIRDQDYQTRIGVYQNAIIALVKGFNSKLLEDLPTLIDASSNSILLNVLHEKAKLWKQSGDFNNALSTYQKAVELIHTMHLYDKKSLSSQHQLSAQAKTIYEEAITVALALDDSFSAFAFSQKAHGLLLTQNLMDRSARKFAGIPDSLLEQERMLQHQISSKERVIRTQQKENGQDTTLFHLKEKYQNFLQQLEQDYPVYYEYKYHIPTADVATIQAKLSYRTALLEYFVGQDSIYTFLITTRDIQVFTHPKTSNFIEQIKAIQQSVIQFSSNEKYYQQYSQAAYQLYQQLVEPAVKALPFYINELVIIADEQLHYIPFQILLSTPPKAAIRYDLLDYLVKDYFISYQYSSALFSDDLHIRQQKKRQTLVGFAPTFDGSPIGPRGEKLSNLLHTKKEVQEIHKVITDGQIYLDSTATATVFKQKVNSSKIAHIASHASSGDIPFGNYIYFADTTVSPTEIYNLPMNLDLVVLSACETAQGKLQKGEGIIGWTQAFLYAGCPSVVASLWRVNDAVTATLMVDFYKSLFAGNTKNVALATAQRNYLNQTTASLEAHPYYWAAFIQIGNTEAVFDQGWDWRLIAGLGLLLLIGLWWIRRRF